MYTVEGYIIPKEEGYFSIEMPKQSILLSVREVQYGFPCLFAFVNHEASKERRNFLHVATGTIIEENPSNLNCIGTFHLKISNHVGHIFEIE